MDNLFQNDLPKSLNLKRNVTISRTKTTNKEFDLKDKRENSIVLGKNTGDASFYNSLEKELYILDFEDLRNQLSPCAILDKGKVTKRCDYFIAEKEEKSICLFNEITSSQEKYLTKKEDTAKQQLLHSLQCVEKCTDLWTEIQSFSNRICLFSYKLSDINILEQKPFNIALSFENDENGTIYSDDEIEKLGFEYRRIGYTPFKIL